MKEGEDREGGAGDEDGGDNGAYFTCRDDAGYENVNQCMKFRTKTDMDLAYIEDVRLASNQGTINHIDIDGNHYGTKAFFQTSRTNGICCWWILAFVGLLWSWLDSNCSHLEKAQGSKLLVVRASSSGW